MQLAFDELLYGLRTAVEIVNAATNGLLLHPLELCIDAKAVFDSIKAPEFSVPAEASLTPLIHIMREDLAAKRLKAMWWIDTRDMCADGMNKGGLPREPILAVCNGEWIIKESAIAFRR